MVESTIDIAAIRARGRSEEAQNQAAYEEHGCKNRREYLKQLADEYGEHVYELADVLGPNEDFDGLISSLEDYDDMGYGDDAE